MNLEGDARAGGPAIPVFVNGDRTVTIPADLIALNDRINRAKGAIETALHLAKLGQWDAVYSASTLLHWQLLQREAESIFSGLIGAMPYPRSDELRRRLRALGKQDAARSGAASGEPRFRFLTVDELLRQPVPSWRVLRVIPARGLVVIWGASGSGKTFVALDMVGAVVRGIPWAGRRTKAGGVAYIAAEGALRNRLDAYMSHAQLDESDLDRLRILDSSVNLLDPAADIEPLIFALRELAEEFDGLAMVVIDTLNRVMPGGDENGPQDMGMVVAAARRIEMDFSCVVVFIHHSGKDDTKGSRGHSSLKAATDAELSVKREGDTRSVTAEKVRDGEDGETLLSFRLRVVDLGGMADIDPEAEPDERLTSCIVEPVEGPARKVRAEPTGKNQRIVLEVLRQLVIESCEALPASSVIPAGTSGVELDALMLRAAPKIPTADAFRARGRVNEALAALQVGGWIGIHRPYVWLV